MTPAQGGAVEKAIHLNNKCDFPAILNVIYKNKDGHHQISSTLAAGQSGSAGKKAIKIVAGICKKKKDGVKCAAYVKSKARQWQIKACQ